MMEPDGDADRWDPARDDFNDKAFNSYGLAAAPQGVSPNTVVKLFVAGIPPILTEEGLRNLMSPVAKILHVILIAHRNIGFVSVRQKDAVKVMAYFNNYKLGDSFLTVKPARPKKQTENEPSAAVSGTTASTKTDSAAGKEEQKEKASNSPTAKDVDDLKIPALNYPSTAKYVQVGQILDVEVLNIISPSQFWICRHPRDADGQLSELHDKMQNHYSSLPPKTGFRPNGSGLYAAPKKDSGNWCRVQALDFDTQSVFVLFLDYGTCDRVSLTNLHSLEGQFCSLPFQAMCCRLAHVQCTSQSKAANFMRQLLSSEQISAKVCDIDGYTLNVELIVSSGQTVNDTLVARNYATYVNGFEPSFIQANTQSVVASDSASRSESSEDNVPDYPTKKDLSYTQITVGERYDVVILYVRNPGDVTVCLKDSLADLNTLCMELNAYQLSDPYVPHVGEIVAAQFADDSCYYRSKVMALDGDSTAVVCFVDFGNVATVDIKSVVPLQPRHLAFPVFGINIKFRSSNVRSEQLAVYCNLNVKVVEQCRSHYVVNLVEDDTEMQLAKSPTNQLTCSKDLSYTQLAVGEQYDVVVLYVRNAGDVTVCLKDRLADLNTLHTELSAYQLSDPYVPHVGEIVAAQFADDSCYYRSKVMTLDGDSTAVVCFVDFGNVTTVDLKSVVPLQPRHLVFPVFGINIKFRSSNVQSELLSEYCNLNVKVVEQREGHYIVNLVKDDTKMHLAKSPTNQRTCSISDIKQRCLDTGRTYKAWVTDGTDIGKFYVKVQEFEYLQIAINEQLQAMYPDESGGYEPQCTGELIAVHLDVDEAWFRAVVTEIENRDAVKCQLIDFGTFVTKSSKDISRFDSRLLMHPAVAFKCSFHNVLVPAVDAWKEDYLNPMTDFYNLTVVEVDGDLHFVELVGVESAVDWKQKLIDDGFLMKARSGNVQPVFTATVYKLPSDDADGFVKTKQDESYDRSTPRSSDSKQTDTKSSCDVVKPESLLSSVSDTEVRRLCHNRERIVVVHANSPSDFYVQSNSDTVQKKLGSLQQSINTFCRQSDCIPDAVSIGQIVAVRHDDGVWYRAEVVEIESGGKFRVHFVDFGITRLSESGDLRLLPDELAVFLPGQAIHCAIDRVVGCEPDGSWSSAVAEWFKNVCENCDFTFKFIFRNDADTIWLVDLLHAPTGRTVKDMLLAEQLALKNNKSVSRCSAVVSQVAGKQVSSKTLPLLLSSTAKNASIQADETVTVTCIHSPSNFFVQQKHQGSSEVLQELKTYCEAHDRVYCPKQVGELIAVIHDNRWHRAEVLSVDANSVNLFLVDYGYTIANVDVKNIRALSLHFATALPKLAICCALGGITGTCADGSYSEAATRWFSDSYLQVTSTVTKVRCPDSSGALRINLKNSTSTKTARQSLLDYGMAVVSTGTAPQEMPRGMTLASDQPAEIISRQPSLYRDAPVLHVQAAVSVVHVISPVDFYAVPCDPSTLDEVISLSERLTQYCTTSDCTGYCPQYVGQPVAAKFEDEWFRAEVVKLMSGDRCKVFFVDFGNTEVVRGCDMRSLHEEFLRLPKQAVHCAIAGVCGTDSAQGFTEAAAAYFNKLYGSRVTLLSVSIADEKHLVDISVNGDSVKQLLIAGGFARSEV